MSALGLVVVESEAHSFMRELSTAVEEYRVELQSLYGQSSSREAYRFLQQFVDLRQYQPQHNESTRNFYSGYEPHWRNILDEDDARMETTERALSIIRGVAQQREVSQAIHVLTGNSGTGKSTGLLRVARQLVADGMSVFQFRGDEDLDVAATVQWLEKMPATVLIFNDCADFADSIGELAEKCESANLRLSVLGSERSTRRSILERKIDPQFLHLRREYQYRQLSDPDIDSLISKLGSRRRLGRITRYNPIQRQRYFTQTASRRLFEGMASLEGGQGFRTRVQKNYRHIQSEHLRHLYAASSIAYEVGYPLPLGVASKIAGLPVIDLEAILASDEQDIMVIESNGVRPPHRLTAALVVESALSVDDKFDAMQHLAFALAPHIDIGAIRSLTRPYRLLRRLMD